MRLCAKLATAEFHSSKTWAALVALPDAVPLILPLVRRVRLHDLVAGCHGGDPALHHLRAGLHLADDRVRLLRSTPTVSATN